MTRNRKFLRLMIVCGMKRMLTSWENSPKDFLNTPKIEMIRLLMLLRKRRGLSLLIIVRLEAILRNKCLMDSYKNLTKLWAMITTIKMSGSAIWKGKIEKWPIDSRLLIKKDAVLKTAKSCDLFIDVLNYCNFLIYYLLSIIFVWVYFVSLFNVLF